MFEDDNEFDKSITSSSRDPPLKKRRIHGSKAVEGTFIPEDERPKPRGRPEVWAEVPIIVQCSRMRISLMSPWRRQAGIRR